MTSKSKGIAVAVTDGLRSRRFLGYDEYQFHDLDTVPEKQDWKEG